MDFIWSEIIIMTKKMIANKENPNGILVDMTTEEENQLQKDIAKAQTDAENNKKATEDKAALKASAKAKLVAGEKLTEEEANILVGV